MIKTSKDVLSKKDIQHISTNVELESDGVLAISIMSSTPRMWQRFTFTPTETKAIARVLKAKVSQVNKYQLACL